MHDLRTNHPETWKELKECNIVVTKNNIPFVSIGADHACEHLHELMKMHSGLVGISNNAIARQRFFMVTPELSNVAQEFKCQFNLELDKLREHHDLWSSAVKKEHDVIDKIKATILKHGNPVVVEGEKLHNMITHAYITDEYVPTILNADLNG
jgi:putative cell wall-binding protein